MSRQQIGLQLQQERKRRGLSQQKVADLIGCARPRISLIENGRYQGSLQLLERYLNLLDMELCAQTRRASRPVFEQLGDIYDDD
ncbi:helix-turn-helix transcriptional regulator [Idiomarina seosinensis]|uniref:Transcriptional regulator n=1 Tax=Idiomarina seosinensis TaxID=281739 RepID=A0A432ZG93_9GAMM|nr:helix-turn-helix transcriptional regulator [Idiomarina seosinensis]RUO76988.1 transcriptional regulator [Idiomarina seosinensis]